MWFFRFMASGAGRITRIVAGAVLIAAGIMAGGWWYLLVIVGAIPLLAGLFDVCTLAPLFKHPFMGEDLRNKAAEEKMKGGRKPMYGPGS